MVSSTVFDALNPLLVCCCDLEINIKFNIFPSTSSCFSLGSPVLAAWPLTFAASVGMLYIFSSTQLIVLKIFGGGVG